MKVKDYVELVGKSKQQVYMDIRLGKINSRKVKKEVEVLEVEYNK